MNTTDFYLWLCIEGQGVLILAVLLYTDIWQVMPRFTWMTIYNVISDIVLPHLWSHYPHRYYYWPGVANNAITMALQVSAMLQLMFLRKERINSATKMGIALLCVFLLEFWKLTRVAMAGFYAWYPSNHIVQIFYIVVEVLWLYWLRKISRSIPKSPKEKIKYA